MNISAPSGGGKTYGALLIAKGMTGDWSKVCLIDTENGSGSLYSHLGDYNTIELKPPFTPESYTEALNIAVQAGMEAVVIDSTTHEWNCLLEQNEKLAQAKYKGNTWSAWSDTTPRHDAYVNAILQSPVHVITCTRSKTETAMIDGKVKKLGLKDQQREGWEYELTISLNVDRDTHMALPSKDRTQLFEGQQPFIITEQTGELIKKWCELGIDNETENIKKIEQIKTTEDLTAFWKSLSKLDKTEKITKLVAEKGESLKHKPNDNNTNS